MCASCKPLLYLASTAVKAYAALEAKHRHQQLDNADYDFTISVTAAEVANALSDAADAVIEARDCISP